MHNRTFIREVVASALTVILATLLLDPLNVWMPNSVQMAVLVFLIIAFTFFALFVWSERGRDEREQLHVYRAGRVAFLAGAGIITLGIISQSVQHTLDPWLVIALVIMVIAKMSGLISSQLRH